MAEEKTKELMKTEAARSLTPLWELERLFDDFFRRPFAPLSLPRLRFAAAEEIVPSVDIFEANGDVVLKVELPGIKKEDIEVTLTDSDITISGEKKKEEEVKRKDFYKYERSYGSFCRTFSLSAEVNADKVKSTFKDGVLEVRMPKSEKAKSKEVKVKVE
jgi:HSP20 family protein